MVDMQLQNLQKTMANYGALICFAGRFSQEIIEELGDAVRKYLETEATSQNDTYNVFSVFIEQTQNIKNYSVYKADSSFGDRISKSGIVAIGKSEAGYFVSSGNVIETADAVGLTARLDEVIALDKQGLKKLYKEQMRKEIAPEAGGAGLGLIDMARRSNKPLEYSIETIDQNLCFFTLKAQV